MQLVATRPFVWTDGRVKQPGEHIEAKSPDDDEAITYWKYQAALADLDEQPPAAERPPPPPPRPTPPAPEGDGSPTPPMTSTEGSGIVGRRIRG